MGAAEVKQAVSVASLAVLILSLGAAGTSLGLIHANTNSGVYCKFFITESQATNVSLHNYNVPTCKLSLASAAIATICLAMLTAIELISVAFKTHVKVLISKLLQAIIFAASIVFLCITTIIVAKGWSETCDTYNKDLPSHRESVSGRITTIDYGFRCHGLQVSTEGLIPPNGQEIIAAAVCAGIGVLLTAAALFFFIVQQIIRIRPQNQNQNNSDNVELSGMDYCRYSSQN